MGFLVNAIRDQKLLDAEVATNDFIEENNISEDSFVYELILSKDRFETEQEALEYVSDKWYSAKEVSEDDKNFTVKVANRSQLDLDTEITVEISRGVIAKAADFRPEVNDICCFADKNKFRLGISLKSIELSDGDGVPFIIELCKVVEGEHASYGKIKITKEDLESMETNFTDEVVGVDLAINEDHKKNEAYGWIKDVFRSREGDILYGQVVWNSKGIAALSEKQYRYISPEFRFSYSHPHTGESFGPTLLGAALTNYPFLKMGAIVELSNKQQTKEPIVKDTISLADHDKKMLELGNKVNVLESQANKSTVVVTKLKEEKVELSAKVKKLEDEKELAEKNAKHEKLFADKKINKAQLEALKEGKDLVDVLSLSDKAPNGKSVGDTGNDDDNDSDIQLSDDDKEMCKRMGLTEKEYVQYGCDDE